MLPPTFALVVSTSGDSAVTSTDSVSAPTRIIPLTIIVCPICRIRPLRSNVAKLWSFATMWYRPGRICGAEKLPSAPVRTSRNAPVSSSVNVMVTPGRAPPCSSVIRPAISAVPCCAKACRGRTNSIAATCAMIRVRIEASSWWSCWLDVRRQSVLRDPSRFERGDDVIERHGRAHEHFVTHRGGNRVQHRAAAGRNRRLADAARADRGFRIRKLHCRPRHVRRHVENGRRLVLIEPARQRHAVLLVVHPPLAERVADAENRAAEHLSAERRRMNDGADV